MSSSEFLQLGGENAVEFKLHPLVVFSVLDHYKRRNENVTHAVGTLLGKRVGNVVEITNSFPVLHVEDDQEDTAAVDMAYNKEMLNLQRYVNSEENVVGWYTTSDNPSYLSYYLHQEYMSQCPDPVMLTVDVALTNARMGVRAYTSHSVLRNDPEVVARFRSYGMEDVTDNRVAGRFSRARLTFYGGEATRVGVDSMINSNSTGDAFDAPARFASNEDNLEENILNLRDGIETIKNYVQLVADGKIEGDKDLGRQIANTLAQVPYLSSENWNANIQDLMMITYLAKLTRAQAALADKICFQQQWS
jgi:translation initiation factor 3 subunit F